MGKITLKVPEGENKNNTLEILFEDLKKYISSDKSISWKLDPLGSIELISGFEVLNLVEEKYWEKIELKNLDYYIRKFNKDTNEKIKPINKYSRVNKSKVYLLEDIEIFLREYPMLKNNY